MPNPHEPARRGVTVHLTPFAPGRSADAVGADQRWQVRWGVTPRQAVGDLLVSLQLSPAQARLRAMALGDIAVIGPWRPDAEPDTRPSLQPLAFIVEGLTLEEAQAALEDMTPAHQRAA